MASSVILYEDDHPFRKQLENVFNSLQNEFRLIGSYEDADDILLHVAQSKPNVIILDILGVLGGVASGSKRSALV
jgi:DNA-binding NarL/FixJ family response regulator